MLKKITPTLVKSDVFFLPETHGHQEGLERLLRQLAKSFHIFHSFVPAGESVAGKSYNQVLGAIKTGGRPLTLTFVPGGTVAGSVTPQQVGAALPVRVSLVS